MTKYGINSTDAAGSCLLLLFSLKNWTEMSHLKVMCLTNAVDCLMAYSWRSKSFPLFLLPVPPVILRLAEPEQRHDTCIEFTVRGYPHPKLRWFHRQKEIQQNDYIRTEMDYYQDYLEGCLTFQNPTHINNGNYTLEASNSLGTVTKTVYGHFLMAPDIDEGEWKLLAVNLWPLQVNDHRSDVRRFTVNVIFTAQKHHLYLPRSPPEQPWSILEQSVNQFGLCGPQVRS